MTCAISEPPNIENEQQSMINGITRQLGIAVPIPQLKAAQNLQLN